MTQAEAIKKIQSFLNKDNLTNHKYCGEDYSLKILGAEDSLERLLNNNTLWAIRTTDQAIAFAESI